MRKYGRASVLSSIAEKCFCDLGIGGGIGFVFLSSGYFRRVRFNFSLIFVDSVSFSGDGEDQKKFPLDFQNSLCFILFFLLFFYFRNARCDFLMPDGFWQCRNYFSNASFIFAMTILFLLRPIYFRSARFVFVMTFLFFSGQFYFSHDAFIFLLKFLFSLCPDFSFPLCCHWPCFIGGDVQ